MLVFERPEFADHEFVGFITDPAAGLRAVIAIHSSVLGPASGAVCMQPYEAPADALSEVLRRSRSMTYKCALADVPMGGGAAMVIGDPARDKSEALLKAFGRAVDRMGGAYVCGRGVGLTLDDMSVIRRQTTHVVDLPGRRGEAAPAVGFGVYQAIRAAAVFRLGRRQLTGLRVAVLGIGGTGWHLCKHLIADGADVFAADRDEVALAQAAGAYGVVPVSLDEFYRLDVDILAPCLESEVLTETTVRALNAKVVCGGADDQLAEDRLGVALADRGILYVPDYVANAGGLLSSLSDRSGAPRNAVERRVAAIYETCLRVFTRSETDSIPTSVAADRMAQEVIDERTASRSASSAVA